MTDYNELKRLAEAAPSGPWIAENDSLFFKDDGYTRHLLDADAGHDVDDEDYYAALSYVAASNPASVLALIAENEQLERKNANQSKSIREYQDLVMGGEVSLGMLKADLRVTTGERDQLKAENEALREEVKELHRKIGGSATHLDKGHGHVFPRADGVRMRCGGPNMCKICHEDRMRKNGEIPARGEAPQ